MDEPKQGAPPLEGGAPSDIQGADPEVHYHPRTDDSYGYYEDPYGYNPEAAGAPASNPATVTQAVTVAPQGGSIQKPPPPPTPPAADDDDDGMLRMSFMEHLEELRTRIIRALYGLGVAFIFSLLYAGKLWDIIQEPASVALKHLGVIPPWLIMTQPMEGFSIIWVKLPLLCSIFIASPWILYQAWAFIAPGLYQKERRWAVPGICHGGAVHRGRHVRLLPGIPFRAGVSAGDRDVERSAADGDDHRVLRPVRGCDARGGVGIRDAGPDLFLTLIRLASPRFLVRHSRYAILAIVIIAAVVTPTPDVFNMMLFAVPMTILYFLGVMVGFVIVLKREGKPLPWLKIIGVILGVAALAAGVVYVMITRFGFKLLPYWPFLSK